MDNQQNHIETNNTLKEGNPRCYRKSLTVTLLIIALGILLELLTKNHRIALPQLPFSIYVGVMFACGIVFLYLNYRNSPFIRLLTGVPTAISAIAGYVACLLCFVFIPQKPLSVGILNDLGLSHIKTSYPFLLAQLYLLIVLGINIINRFYPIRWKNISFFLSHTGLWIILAAAGLGSGDLKRLKINLLENEKESSIGLTPGDEMYKLPFSVRLLDFTIEEYNPALIILDNEKGGVLPDSPKPHPEAFVGTELHYNHWYIYLTKYIPNAIYSDSGFHATDLPGSYTAAYLEVIDLNLRKKDTGWISAGNLYQEPQFFMLDSSRSIALSSPEPKGFYSRLAITSDSTSTDTIILKVNNPYEIKGWKLYQSSYDLSKGKWSTLSVIEAVNDPWIPVVYTGFAMLFIGAFLMIWTGKTKQQ